MPNTEKIIINSLTNLKDFLLIIKERYHNRPAYRFIENDETIEKTYANLCDDSLSISYYLNEKGINRKHIALLGGTSYKWVCTYLGICNSSNIVIPIDKMLPVNEMINVLKLGDTDMLFVSEEFDSLSDEFIKNCPHIKKLFHLRVMNIKIY